MDVLVKKEGIRHLSPRAIDKEETLSKPLNSKSRPKLHRLGVWLWQDLRNFILENSQMILLKQFLMVE